MPARPIILLSAALLALVAAAPTSRPVVGIPEPPSPAAWPALVDALGSRDAAEREAARESLMLLSREDLPALAGQLRGRLPLGPVAAEALRDVVVHVYLTGMHGFAGKGRGLLGIVQSASYRPPPPEPDGEGRVVISPQDAIDSTTIGMDAYRVLRPGDTVVGIGPLPAIGRAVDGGMTRVDTFAALQQYLAVQRPGLWVRVRFVRDGRPREAAVRLSPESGSPAAAAVVAGQLPGQVIIQQQGGVVRIGGLADHDARLDELVAQGDAYWDQAFADVVPTTRPAPVEADESPEAFDGALPD